MGNNVIVCFGAGELGWELFHKKEYTTELYEALLTAGNDHGIGDFGTYALNSLRLEKGFRWWGFEVLLKLFSFCKFLYPVQFLLICLRAFLFK